MKAARIAMLVAVSAAGVLMAQEEGRKFNVHGFMDMQLENQQFIGDGSMYEFIGLDEDWHVRLDHVNLYFDFTPNDRIRSMAEIRFLTQPDGIGGVPGIITNIRFQAGSGGNTVSDTSDPKQPTSTRVSDESTGGFLKWGGVSLERAWLQILFNQAFELTMGEFISPVGIWNEDHGSPVVTSVQSPYGFSFLPVFPTKQVGFVGHGNFFVRDLDLGYWLTLSTGRNSLAVTRLADLAVGARVKLEANPDLALLSSMAGGLSAYTGMLRDRTAWERISFTVDVFGDSAEQARDFGAGFSDPDNKDFSYTTELQARETALGADYKLEVLKGLTLQTEFLYQLLQNHLDNDAQTHTFDWYTMLRYKTRPWTHLTLTPYFMFERMWAVDGDNNPASWFSGNAQMRGQVVDAFTVWTVGANLTLFTNFTLKLEGNYVDCQTAGVMAPYPDIWDMCTFNAQFCVAF